MYKIETGKRFGRLVIVEEVERKIRKSGKKERQFLCQCDCGSTKIIPIQTLLRGNTKSCGCLRSEILSKLHTKYHIDVNDVLCGLRIIEVKDKCYLTECEECGNIVKKTGKQLFDLTGCRKCNRKKNNYKKKLYRVWLNMKQRCSNPNHPKYKNYGGRGISVCQEWQDDFEAFEAFAMSHGWESGLQVDRIDNNGNYEPDNVRFTTSAQNCQNKRNNKISENTAKTIKVLLAEHHPHKWIAEYLGIPTHIVGQISRGESWENVTIMEKK